jgi:3-isopropylmalate/(R)-2-methylmalate dehydratase small subunit
MEKFTVLTGAAAALLRPNINTDLLAPIRRPDRPDLPPAIPKTFATNIAQFLLAPWRYDINGEIPSFVLNRPAFRNAKILLAGPNFGCGSSRETAVWTLVHFGIRCVIAPSFGTIFHGNSFKNGLLPITLPMGVIEHLATKVEVDDVALPLTVSLVNQTIRTADGEVTPFSLVEFRRHALLEGLDHIEQTLIYKPEIDAFTAIDRKHRPWVYA